MQGVDVVVESVPIPIVDDDIVSDGESFSPRGLRSENVTGRSRIDPIALHNALDLQLFRSIHHEYSIEIATAAALDEQRNHMDLIGASRSSRPRLHSLSDRRMGNGF